MNSREDYVIATVESRTQAEAFVDELCRAGFARHEISGMFPDRPGQGFTPASDGSRPAEAAAAGAASGALLGGTLGMLASIGVLPLPGQKALIAAGPVMAALSGAAAGAAVGIVAGGLVGLGFPESEATKYESAFDCGDILIAVPVHSRAERRRAEGILKRFGAHDVWSSSPPSVQPLSVQRPLHV